MRHLRTSCVYTAKIFRGEKEGGGALDESNHPPQVSQALVVVQLHHAFPRFSINQALPFCFRRAKLFRLSFTQTCQEFGPGSLLACIEQRLIVQLHIVPLSVLWGWGIFCSLSKTNDSMYVCTFVCLNEENSKNQRHAGRELFTSDRPMTIYLTFVCAARITPPRHDIAAK